ncbi:hypothetical protein ACWDYH_01865 [Nocardia goodfellowii]
MATQLTTPKRCSSCREFATYRWPVTAPHDQVDMICDACFTEYLAACEADEDDYSC